jgi:hypothetical protein
MSLEKHDSIDSHLLFHPLFQISFFSFACCSYAVLSCYTTIGRICILNLIFLFKGDMHKDSIRQSKDTRNWFASDKRVTFLFSVRSTDRAIFCNLYHCYLSPNTNII